MPTTTPDAVTSQMPTTTPDAVTSQMPTRFEDIANARMETMTQEEADKVATVIATADNGCSVCVRNLCDAINAARLGFTFALGGPKILIQPEWSDDPDDASRYGGVTATPVEQSKIECSLDRGL